MATPPCFTRLSLIRLTNSSPRSGSLAGYRARAIVTSITAIGKERKSLTRSNRPQGRFGYAQGRTSGSADTRGPRVYPPNMMKRGGGPKPLRAAGLSGNTLRRPRCGDARATRVTNATGVPSRPVHRAAHTQGTAIEDVQETIVVLTSLCPNSSCTVRMSEPPSRRCLANRWPLSGSTNVNGSGARRSLPPFHSAPRSGRRRCRGL